jgi:hypothetical protein
LPGIGVFAFGSTGGGFGGFAGSVTTLSTRTALALQQDGQDGCFMFITCRRAPNRLAFVDPSGTYPTRYYPDADTFATATDVPVTAN